MNFPWPKRAPKPEEQAKQAEEEAARLQMLRMNGRPFGMFYRAAGRHFLDKGFEWPAVIRDEATETLSAPATPMGLLAVLATWDSLLTDEEYTMLREVVEQMVPMGLIGQKAIHEMAEHERLHHHEHGGQVQ